MTIRGVASQVALFDVSAATIGAVPLLDWSAPDRPDLDAAARERIFRDVVTAAETIIRGKGATNYAIGLTGARVLEAILRDEQAVLPVSSLLSGHGLDDVCLSMPSIVGRDGVTGTLPTPLADDELAGLRRSAQTVRGVVGSLGI